ncbi:MAG: hypothetical protein L0Y54_17240 [Sporichthyaceae bacterium]|nr:hypothetical protein [Sporichthyaceae bacterium]
MTVFEPTLVGWPTASPWSHPVGSSAVYGPDYNLLAALLSVAVKTQAASESGVFPRGIDLWLSHELRRCGFSDEETWPRPTRPRIFPREVALLLNSLPASLRGLDLREEIRRRVNETPSVSPTDAVVLGRAYDKQVDVCISRWDRGPEILISTKAQLSSFGKNLPNRFEEAYGDAANLRARYPLAAVGYFFVQRATILTEEPDAFERAKDMIRKLRAVADGPGYTATGLCLADWDESVSAEERRASVILDDVPEDIRPDQFMVGLVEQVLRVTPVTHHVSVRERYEGRVIPVSEGEPEAVVGELDEPGSFLESYD